ncbi:MAG: cytochrome b/b6 domain-containing protein [Thermodesulfobacteriota bacterium]
MPIHCLRVPMRHPASSILLAAFLLAFLAGSALALDNGQCNDCHGDSGIAGWSAEERASNVTPGGAKKPPAIAGRFPGMSLHVDPEAYKNSVHGDLSCMDCHGDIKELPHAASLKPVDCSGCHSEAAAAYAKSSHVVTFRRRAVQNPPRCVDCHGAHAVPKAAAASSPVNFRNVAATCARCHGDEEVAAERGIPIPGAARMYAKSVHNRAIVEKGLNKSASCIDCHGAHDMKDHRDPASPINKENLPATCGRCHFGVYAIYKDSVHGTALERGVPDAPNCANCHGEHEIQAVTGPTIAGVTGAGASCAVCHGAEKLAARYGVPVEKVEGYEQSFHGLSARLGDRTVADCASCHGTHAIFPSKDPRSTVNARNLPVTCGKCHPGATENFARGNVHVGPGGLGGTIKYWTETLYIWLIVLVIGGMLVHNGFDFFRKMQAMYRKRQEQRQPMYERLNRSERIQHLLTLTTFFTLVVTGFALKYKWSIPLIPEETSVFLRYWGHRVAAVLMIVTSVYHVGYAAFTPRGRGQVMRMIPRWKDATDIYGSIRYFLGLDHHKPKFDRFSYVEKAEYLALVWGTIVMVLTGLLLWFEEEALKVLPLWGLDVANIVHYYEAILATLAIIVWHLYYVFMNPDFAPMSFTWLDGKLSRDLMEHEHALELEEIEAYERSGNPPPPDVTRIVKEEE